MLAASRGVRVAALFDDLGSRELRAEDRRRLAEGGVELRFFNAPAWGKRLASLLRNHRKLLLVDDRLQQPGSVGFRWNLALDRRNWTRRLEDRPNSQVFPDPQTVGAAPCVS
jgi:phosphatidylserine/phosphatidylglycerophosphate/cardiolipin synthase-like enzyme